MTVTDTAVEETPHTSSLYLDSFKPRLMDWTAARVFAAKNLKIAMRYPANFIIWGVLPLLWLAPYIMMMTALGGPGTSTSFTEISGFDDFVKFVIIGFFVYQYVDASIWSVGNNFRYEQFSGTLEPLFVTPVPRISILTGAALSDSIQTSISAIVFLISAAFLFGVSYALTAIAPVIVLLLMMILALYGFGFMVAGMILVFKDPSVLTQFVDTALFTVSPVNYPLQALPAQARYAAYLVPSTIAIIVIRELAITGVFELGRFLSAAAGLGITILFFWFVGIASFKYAERWTKKRGSMGGF